MRAHALYLAGIEGSAEMYRTKSQFDTAFAFSRFGAKRAAPRNISAMRG